MLEDFNWEIQLAVYCHPNASEETKVKALEKLPTSVYAREQIAQHRQSPPDLLKALDTPEQDPVVIAVLTMNPNSGLASRYED